MFQILFFFLADIFVYVLPFTHNYFNAQLYVYPLKHFPQ